MRTHMLLGILIVVAAALGAGRQPAAPPPKADPPPALKIGGAGVSTRSLSMTEFAALPHKSVVVKDHDGEVRYEGVTVQELLSSAGMAFGHSLRGPRLRDYLLAEAADGYGVVFALPELTDEFSDRVVIVADRVNGAALADKDGPLRIVVSDEKKHARWVRNVVSLTVRAGAREEPGSVR